MKMVRTLLILTIVLALGIATALAQAPAAGGGAAGAQRGAGAPGGGGAPGGAGGAGRGGGGRGGGGGPQLTMTTSAWADGTDIPLKYTMAAGANAVSPELKWTNVPMGTVAFALILHDPDVSVGGTDHPDDVLHWLIWNIPGTATGLPENVPQGAKLPDGSQQVSLRGAGYMGPGAAATAPKHHYTLELYALNAMLDVTPAATPAETRALVLKAMVGKVVGKAAYVGLFHQPPAPAQ